MEAGFVVQIGQQGHRSDRVRCVRDYELGSPFSSGLVEEFGLLLADCLPAG